MLARVLPRARPDTRRGDADRAQSVADRATELKYLRTYPSGPRYAPVTGFYSLVYGATGLERTENSILSGSDDRFFVRPARASCSPDITSRVAQSG